MEIYSTDRALQLIETNVIEAFETGTCYRADSMVWDEKMFLPSHKDILLLCDIVNCDRTPFSQAFKLSECIELAPVAKINLCICSPVFVSCEEAVFRSNDFPFKVCRKGRVVFRQT